ncbi:MAG: hypothetical protein ACRELF_08485, partial [Gemmataceae bacterium]
MRVPASPPNWLEAFQESPSVDDIKKLVQTEVEQFVRKANEAYLHWDKLRYQPLPDGVAPELAWAAVALSRKPQQQELPLVFLKNRKLKYW